jgi:acyl-CoA synthetase (AMP-forming)/AMP-acid ligase II
MLQDLFRAASVINPSKVAVVDASRRLSYGELRRDAEAFSRQLQELGAQLGDRVAVQLPNSVDAAVALWGALEAGCVIVPIQAGLKPDALAKVMTDADPHWVVQKGSEITPRHTTCDEDSRKLAALIYTSGSMGEPKGVMLTHANMNSAIQMVNGYLQITPEDVIYSALPLSSSYGLYQLLLGLAIGATITLDRSFSFPAACLAFASKERATVMATVPTILGWMAQSRLLDQHDLRSLRILTSAGAALPSAQALLIRERLPWTRLFVMYGQTECKRISWLDPAELALHSESVGKGLAGQEHRVVDQMHQAVAPGVVGELIVRGQHVMQGYWRKPELTAAKIRHAADGGLPWMHTGDAFTVDNQGYLYFHGRMDEVLKIGGNKVCPYEIELCLARMEGVREVAVIGIPDDQWGEAAAAFIVRNPASPLEMDDVKRHCSKNLRGFMVPRLIRFVDELPKTAAGKISKKAISLDGQNR